MGIASRLDGLRCQYVFSKGASRDGMEDMHGIVYWQAIANVLLNSRRQCSGCLRRRTAPCQRIVYGQICRNAVHLDTVSVGCVVRQQSHCYASWAVRRTQWRSLSQPTWTWPPTWRRAATRTRCGSGTCGSPSPAMSSVGLRRRYVDPPRRGSNFWRRRQPVTENDRPAQHKSTAQT